MELLSSNRPLVAKKRSALPQRLPSKTPLSNSVRSLQEELSLWKSEITHLLQLVSKLDEKYLSPSEQNRLSAIVGQLIFLQDRQLVGHHNVLLRWEQGAAVEPSPTLTDSHQRLRRTFQQLKSKVFPLLPKMVRVVIW